MNDNKGWRPVQEAGIGIDLTNENMYRSQK